MYINLDNIIYIKRLIIIYIEINLQYIPPMLTSDFFNFK